ncbi:MAG TPA: DUF1302 domain-containing protein [Azospira sp.]|nr:DUF1302 domain-containing protein [Azospira sp.]
MTFDMTRLRRSRTSLAVSLAAGLFGALASAPALAERWQTESGTDVDFSSTVSYGFQVRASKAAGDNIGNDNGGNVPTSGAMGARLSVNQFLGAAAGATSNPDFNFLNGDNGNQNYKRGDLVSSALKGTHELGVKWTDGWRFLGRATWVYDDAVTRTRRTPLADDAKDLAAANVTLLDLWVSKELKLVNDRPALIKVGNQVVSWGEDIFVPGGVNMINAIDLRKAHQPGTQLKEIFRPAPMIFASAGITETTNLEGYYQFDWNSYQFDPVGTFFSAADVVGKGQLPAYIPSSTLGPLGLLGTGACPAQVGDKGNKVALGCNVVPFTADQKPKSGGQYGLAARWRPKETETEFAFYYIRYHDKLPFQTFTVNPGDLRSNVLGVSYANEYGKDKDLFGFSLNTKVGSWAVGAELSYRPRESVAIDPTVPFNGAYSVFDAATAGPTKTVAAGGVTTVKGFVEEKKWQGHLTGFYMFENDSIWGKFQNALGAAEGYVLAEASATYFPDLDPSRIPYYVFPSYAVPDKLSAGYVVEIGLTYPNAFGSGITVSPQIDLTHGIKGTSPNALPWVEGAKSAFFGVNFDRRNIWRGQVGYSTFWGGGLSNPYRDRDFFGASVSYSF